MMRKILLRFYKIFYRKMDINTFYSLKKLSLIFFLQKIIGINRKIPWPVHFTSEIKAHKNITKKTQKNPGFAPGCYIDARNGIIFEENVWIGPNVSIISQDHSHTKYSDYIKNTPIIIGKNSLLGSSCTILPGVVLGEHTIVAAGSVVARSFKGKNQLIGGNPAMILKKLDDYTDDITK